MSIEQLKAERANVLAILGSRILSQDAIKRGWKRYDELGDIIAAEEQKSVELTPEIKATIDRTWAQLDPTGKRRAKP